MSTSILIVSFIIFILCDSPVSSVLQYSISAVYMTDTERYVPYTEPSNEGLWRSFTEDAQNLGLLFAGKAEFSWVVDLRVLREDDELWSIGNLFSATWVLTTCRARKYLEDAWQNADVNTRALVPGAGVTYFQLYFWEYLEDNNFQNFNGKGPYGGVRRIDSYILHPQCNLNNLVYDFAMLKLDNEIPPAFPFIGYMPLAKSPTDDRVIANVDFSRLESSRKMCFVGSVGRKYANWPFPGQQGLVEDFKVRFRVYHESIANCTNLMDKLCDSSRLGCAEVFSDPSKLGREWECMRTRARVGTVCDHDRGAPVVCQDEVVGMVAYGALRKYCNDRIPVPFVVIKLNRLTAWLRDFM